MSFTQHNLQAFSEALRLLHATPTAEDRLSRAVARLQRDPESRPENPDDEACLIALLQSHVAPPTPAARPARDVDNGGSSLPEAELESFRLLGLTPRECEVMGWLARGKRDAEIAAILGCAVKTVGKHVEHILSKLKVETRLGAAHVVRHARDRKADR